MANILLFHPDAAVQVTLRRAIEPAGHVVEYTANGAEVADLVAHQEAIRDPFDLLLLATPAAMAGLTDARLDHGVALLGTELADARAIGTVDPAAPAEAIVARLEAALARREAYLGRLGEWDQALAYLQAVGQLEQHATVAAHQPAPPAVTGESAVAQALQAAEDAANAALQPLPGSLDAALAPLAAYQATPTYWTQLRHAYAHQRVRCLALLATLRRLDADKLAHGRVVAPGHFMLPVGGTHRVFFRWSNGRRVLEAFVPASDAQATMERLTHAPEPPVPLVEQPLPA